MALPNLVSSSNAFRILDCYEDDQLVVAYAAD